MSIGALAALAPWSLGCAVGMAAPPAASPQNAITPAQALQRLTDGNTRYAANRPSARDLKIDAAARASSQHPVAAILSCADARVTPESVFDQGPGDLLVVRVAGNVVSPNLLASLEYGVAVLKAPLVMVLGHSQCGAVTTALSQPTPGNPLPGELPGLIAQIRPAVEVARKAQGGNLLDNAIAENVRRQVAQLKDSQKVVGRLYGDNRIDIVGAVFDLQTGRVTPV